MKKILESLRSARSAEAVALELLTVAEARRAPLDRALRVAQRALREHNQELVEAENKLDSFPRLFLDLDTMHSAAFNVASRVLPPLEERIAEAEAAIEAAETPDARLCARLALSGARRAWSREDASLAEPRRSYAEMEADRDAWQLAITELQAESPGFEKAVERALNAVDKASRRVEKARRAVEAAGVEAAGVLARAAG